MHRTASQEEAFTAREAEVGQDQANLEQEYVDWKDEQLNEPLSNTVSELGETAKAEREIIGKPESIMEMAFAQAADKADKAGENNSPLLEAGDEANQRKDVDELSNELPTNERGLVPAYHYSRETELTELDPAKYGPQ